MTDLGQPSYPGNQRVTREVTVGAPRPSGLTVVRRVLLLIFGAIQILILLRIVLLLLGADREHEFVEPILAASGALVEPFRGVLRLDHIAPTGGSVLDLAAVVALVGWTILEFFALALAGLGRRSTSAEA
jgi:uncharacterized protein YggT (Ycf19 family)